MIHTGDCIEVMAGMPADSVDAIVTDPPYGLEFMGKGWDSFGGYGFTDGAERREGPAWHSGDWMNKRCVKCGHISSGGSPCRCAEPQWVIERGTSTAKVRAFQAWCEAWGREALRVTKPGGYLLAFGGTRTHHRLVCGLEDAGWIIRDELDWIYASGFPKGKANLKPAHEPIVLARKPGPLQALRIDECRIAGEPWTRPNGEAGAGFKTGKFMGVAGIGEPTQTEGVRENAAGRWPSNVLLSDPALFDEKNAEVVGSGATSGTEGDMRIATRPRNKGWVNSSPGDGVEAIDNYGDSGGYSRFFIVPKSARSDRDPLLRGQIEPRVVNEATPPGSPGSNSPRAGAGRLGPRENFHPTVKPTDLMRHLVRLVTPQGGTVLDCFLGSGSTAIAAELEGFAWVGIEKDPEYVAIAEARLNGTQRGLGLDVPAPERRDIGKQRGNKDEDGNPTLAGPANLQSSWFHSDEVPDAGVRPRRLTPPVGSGTSVPEEAA